MSLLGRKNPPFKQFPRRLQTYHIHNLHEAESEIDSEWLGIICNWSLQGIVIFQQLLVKLPLKLSLQGLFGHRNKKINNKDSTSEKAQACFFTPIRYYVPIITPAPFPEKKATVFQIVH